MYMAKKIESPLPTLQFCSNAIMFSCNVQGIARLWSVWFRTSSVRCARTSTSSRNCPRKCARRSPTPTSSTKTTAGPEAVSAGATSHLLQLAVYFPSESLFHLEEFLSRYSHAAVGSGLANQHDNPEVAFTSVRTPRDVVEQSGALQVITTQLRSAISGDGVLIITPVRRELPFERVSPV